MKYGTYFDIVIRYDLFVKKNTWNIFISTAFKDFVTFVTFNM